MDFYNAQGSSWLPHDELDFGVWQKKLGGLQIEPFKEMIQKISDWTNHGSILIILDFWFIRKRSVKYLENIASNEQ